MSLHVAVLEAGFSVIRVLSGPTCTAPCQLRSAVMCIAQGAAMTARRSVHMGTVEAYGTAVYGPTLTSHAVEGTGSANVTMPTEHTDRLRRGPY
mmetsp:Transcript_30843/g.92546  ORF Transcript_30843/g.92546 Transcript_30843/m.92546 type:complete len:94 (-) Transcript_30843:236-517(-)